MKIPNNISLMQNNNFQLFLAINLRSYRAQVNAILRQSIPILKRYRLAEKSKLQKSQFWYDYAKRKSNTIKIEIKKLEHDIHHITNSRSIEEKLDHIEIEVKKLKKHYVSFIQKMN